MSARSDYLAFLTAAGFPPNRAVLFEEGSGVPVEYYTATPVGEGGSPGWSLPSGYVAGNAPAITDYWSIPASDTWLSLTKETIFLIRRKHDLTLRVQETLNTDWVAPDEACRVHLPWVNSEVYWDFGNYIVNRVGYTYMPTTDIEAWAFRASTVSGKASIWLNGARVVQRTGGLFPRTATANAFFVNHGPGVNGDLQDFLFVAFVPDEVSDAVLATFTPNNVLIAPPLPPANVTGGVRNRIPGFIPGQHLLAVTRSEIIIGYLDFRRNRPWLDWLTSLAGLGQQVVASGALTFGTVFAQTMGEILVPFTIPGLSVPKGSFVTLHSDPLPPANTFLTADMSADNVVSVRFHNYSGGTVVPPEFNVDVFIVIPGNA